MNIDFETMSVLEEESHNESLGGGVYGSLGAASAEGSERREGGKRGRRPGRKAQLDKQDMKAKLERSRQSARECRARKKLRYQYLEELVADRERSVLSLRKELDKELLRQLIGSSANIIEDRCTNTTTNLKKGNEWKNIMIRFNELTGKSRSTEQLKLAWKRMKLSAKSNISSHMRALNTTGGGCKPPSPSPGDLQIMSIAPHDFLIEVNDYDSDAVYYKWNCELDQGRIPEGLEAMLQEIGVVKHEDMKQF